MVFFKLFGWGASVLGLSHRVFLDHVSVLVGTVRAVDFSVVND